MNAPDYRALLERWRDETRDALTDPDPNVRALAAQWSVVVEQLDQTVRGGRVDVAIHAALHAGWITGWLHAQGHVKAAQFGGPLAHILEAGKRSATAAKGGPAKRGARKRDDVTDDQLRAEVNALIAQGEKPTNARRRVGKKHGIPPSTVRDRIR